MAQISRDVALRGRHRPVRWPGSLTVAVLAVLLVVAGSWYGVLEHEAGHPAVRLVGALGLGVLGTIAVVLAGPSSHPVDGIDTLAMILGLLSMAAALIHLAVISQHLAEYWLYGVFFIVVGIAQLGWALVVPRVRPRWLLLAGAAGNAAVVVAWLVTRTTGSLVGPDASMPARAGFGDVVCTIIEGAIVVGTLGALGRRLRAPAGPPGERSWMIVALIVLPFLVLSLYSAIGGAPYVSEVG
jgi:hypothetical protein